MNLEFATLLLVVLGSVLLIIRGVSLDGRFNHGFRYYRWGAHRKPPKWATLKRSGRKTWKKELRKHKGGGAK